MKKCSKIELIKNRINYLESNNKDNYNIVRKLKRQLTRLEK